MRGREIGYLVIGLIVGLMIGGIAASGNDTLRKLFGCAGCDPSEAKSVYYQVDLESAGQWLLDAHADAPTPTAIDNDTQVDLAQAIDQIASLPDAPNFRQGLRDSQEAIGTVLTEAFRTLGGQETTDNTSQSVQNLPVRACLGLNDDPYSESGPALFLYLKVPEEEVPHVPEAWEQLAQPKENDLYWQLLACHPGSR
jgi:hypothetical protein